MVREGERGVKESNLEVMRLNVDKYGCIWHNPASSLTQINQKKNTFTKNFIAKVKVVYLLYNHEFMMIFLFLWVIKLWKVEINDSWQI